MNQSNPNRKPLEGLRVIDFSMFVAGPLCTRSLADLGADVIKIEPKEGDNLRNLGPFRDGVSSYFGHVNAGKRSVILDLKQPADLATAIALVKGADLVIENARPGVMKRLGLDYATLSALNPRLIYCSVSGFGQSGPGADRPAYAQTVQAASGYDLAFMSYQDGQDRPPNTGIFTADILAGVYAFSGVMTALYDRERTGQGQLVDVAMMDCMLNLLPYEFQEAQFPAGKRRPVYKPMRTTDGYVMVALVSPRNFIRLFETICHDEFKTDPKFSSASGRAENWDELMEHIEKWTEIRTTDACQEGLLEAGIPVTKYQTVREALQDPQLQFRGSLATVKDSAGSFLVPNLPFKLSNAETGAADFAPRAGEHTDAVLRELSEARSSPDAAGLVKAAQASVSA